MQEVTYTVEYVPLWVGALYGIGIAVALCFLMYLIGIPIEKIKSRRKGQRPLYVGFNVIAVVLLVGLGVLGGALASNAGSLPDKTTRGILTSLVSNMKTTTETSTLTIKNVSVDKAVSSGSESGTGNFVVGLSDVEGNTYRINRFIDNSLDKLDILVIRDVRVACTAETECSAFGLEVPDNTMIDSLINASIKFGTVTSITY